MKVAERTGAPALGNAIAYFAVLWAVGGGVEWIKPEHQVEAVAMAGALFTYALNELRHVSSWLGELIRRKRGG